MSESEQPIIRRRNVPSRRRRDGLIRYAKDVTSQNGEDGILERIFHLLPSSSASQQPQPRWCVDVGAWDGRHLSNTYSLLVNNNESDEKSKWRGVLIEANIERFQQLQALHEPLDNLCLNLSISGVEGDSNSITSVLKQASANVKLPYDFDFICIDIDGSDYWVLFDLWKSGSFRPKVVCVEFNPSMPDDLIYIPPRNDSIRQGASLAALVELATSNSYTLVETTLYNAFFVDQHLYEHYLSQEVPDPSIEALHESTMGTSLYQLYDGTIKLWGCSKLLWHRLPIDERKLQMIPPEERHFPFAPRCSFDTSLAVDMSPYCRNKEMATDSEKRVCAEALLRQLRKEGFCLVRGTAISQQTSRNALDATDSFLQQADESVRRSCLTKDRARRGYSPMCTENFASLIGDVGPNDLVRKFRMGPAQADGSSSLLQSNIWPSEDSWDTESALSFRSSLETYYDAACEAADSVVQAICRGLLDECPELRKALVPLTKRQSVVHTGTSILTLLGYRVGSRHKGKNKGPLVAAHTDVGVITFLLFDDGTCAALQRSDGHGKWVDVTLPEMVPEDPVFVVNVADCLSELSGGALPSTLHRVVARQGTRPRNCCALFVGLNPEECLELEGERLTYEDWRKGRIARAQSIRQKPNEGSNRIG